MRLWLWETATHRGVTDDEDRAMAHAEEYLGDSATARVELAVLSASFNTLTNDHIRTGIGWTGTNAAGSVRWAPLAIRITRPCPREEPSCTQIPCSPSSAPISNA
jgi:hypothetical protein